MTHIDLGSIPTAVRAHHHCALATPHQRPTQHATTVALRDDGAEFGSLALGRARESGSDDGDGDSGEYGGGESDGKIGGDGRVESDRERAAPLISDGESDGGSCEIVACRRDRNTIGAIGAYRLRTHPGMSRGPAQLVPRKRASATLDEQQFAACRGGAAEKHGEPRAAPHAALKLPGHYR